MDHNDGDLIRRWNTGDPAAFEELVRQWEMPIGRFLTRLVGERETAQDLKQEVFLRVFQSGATLRENGTFRAWLYKVALNVARDQLRRPTGPRSLEKNDIVASAVDVEADSERQELSDLIAKAIKALPVAQREVLVLRHYEEMNFEEISRLLHTPASTLKSRFAAALIRLRNKLKQLNVIDEERQADELS